MHSDVEHRLRERGRSVAITQIPYFGTDLSIKLSLLHHLLHLRVTKDICVILIEQLEYLIIISFIFWLEVPDGLLLFLCQTY